MKVMLAVTGMAAMLAAAQCGSGGGAGGKKCDVVVLEDTTLVYVSEGSVEVAAKKDTIPRPRALCVTFYAKAQDTIPKP